MERLVSVSAQEFLKPNSEVKDLCLDAAQELFKKALSYDQDNLCFLDDLHTKDFDLEQIWEQIQLFNTPVIDSLQDLNRDLDEEMLQEDLAHDEETGSIDYDAMLEEGLKNNQSDEEGSAEEEDVSEQEELEEDEEEELEEYEEEIKDAKPSKQQFKIKRRTEVDDDFFSVDQMEQFAELGEAQDFKNVKIMNEKTSDDEEDLEDEEDENDMFSVGRDIALGTYDEDNEDEDQDNANDINYADFFEAPEQAEKAPRKRWQDDMEDKGQDDIDDEEQDEEMADMDEDELDPELVEDKSMNLFDDEAEEKQEEILSTFEKSQLKMQKQIAALEAGNMGEKEWTMRGEVNSKSRPMNSLLEQDLDVEIAAKPVPVITEETTQTLADLIIQRIKDQAFDDVVRKAPPKDSVYDPNRRWELDDEKNTKSLAEVYEDEYKRQTSTKEIKSEKVLALEKKHEEISLMFENISQQLDALSNWHFVPKSATLELEVIPAANVPAISLEEVIPATVSTAQLAAPKEIYDGKVAKSQAELDTADKKKLRVRAKRKAASARADREAAKKLRVAANGGEERMSKDGAMKQLMKQGNVTLVVDGRDKSKYSKGSARTVAKGDKVVEEKVKHRASMLKL